MKYEFLIACSTNEDALPTLDRLERIREEAGLPNRVVRYAPWGSDTVTQLVAKRDGRWYETRHPDLPDVPQLFCDEVLVFIDNGTEEQIAAWKAALDANNWPEVSGVRAKHWSRMSRT